MKIKRIWGWMSLFMVIPVVALLPLLDDSPYSSYYSLFFALFIVAVPLVIMPYCFDLTSKTPKHQSNSKEENKEETQ